VRERERECASGMERVRWMCEHVQGSLKVAIYTHTHTKHAERGGEITMGDP
jgi:hypothetical protein